MKSPREEREDTRLPVPKHKDCDWCRGCVVGLCLALASCAGAPVISEPLNLSKAKDAVIAYCESGAYRTEIDRIAAEAKTWVEQRVAKRRAGERLALVLDIDETLLSNEPLIRRLDFAFIPKEWDLWVHDASCPAIPSMKDLYLRSRALGVEIILITGRPEKEFRECTERNLRKEGLADYSRLIMADYSSLPRKTSAEIKTAARAALEQTGYIIIANIGDQESDLTGGHSEKVFKLPNPFYITL